MSSSNTNNQNIIFNQTPVPDRYFSFFLFLDNVQLPLSDIRVDQLSHPRLLFLSLINLSNFKYKEKEDRDDAILYIY